MNIKNRANDKQNIIKILISQLNNKRIEFNKIIKK